MRLQVRTPKAEQVLLRMAVVGYMEAEADRALSTGAWELIEMQHFLHQTFCQIHPPAV